MQRLTGKVTDKKKAASFTVHPNTKPFKPLHIPAIYCKGNQKTLLQYKTVPSVLALEFHV